MMHVSMDRSFQSGLMDRMRSLYRFSPPALCPMRPSPRSQYSHRHSIKSNGSAPHGLNLPTNIPLDVPLPGFDSIRDALHDLRQGKFLVVLDDENRENEGDLIIAADKVTPQAMAFMVQHTSGVVCIGMEGKDLDRLRLPLMISSAENEDSMYTAFTVTVDLREGVTTGISAADRAATINRMANPVAEAREFRRPGHIFPLRARPGGTLVRPGHTEASVDLSRLAGLFPAGALCEIVSPKDGSMARTPELLEFSRLHGLRCITIADLMRYRLQQENLVSKMNPIAVNTRYGPVKAHVFTSLLDGVQHVAFVVGDVAREEEVLLQVQHEGSVVELLGNSSLGSSRLDTHFGGVTDRSPTSAALEKISSVGRGVLIVMRSHDVSLVDQLTHLNGASQRATSSESGNHSVSQKGGDWPLDLVDYGLIAQMVSSLDIKSIALIETCTRQIEALTSCGVKIIKGATKSNANAQVKAGSSSH